MLKLLACTKHAFPHTNTLFGGATRGFGQFSGRRMCIPRAGRLNTNVVLMKSSFAGNPSAKKIGWGISGVVILASMIAVDKSCVLLLGVPLLLFHARELRVIIKMLPRDVTFLKRYVHAAYILKRIKVDNWTVSKLFKQRVGKSGNAVMMFMDGHEWKYKEVNSYANRVSRLFQKHKMGKGDVVALMLNNSPEMMAVILGLTQLGIVCSLINTNLRTHGLKHCIEISNCSCLIIDNDHIEAIEEIRDTLDKNIKMYQLNDSIKADNYLKFEEALYKESDENPEIIVKPNHDDAMLYIYTSGTSGLPKAAIIPHAKFLVSNLASMILLGMNKNDKIYNPLPLYHTTGLIVGAAPAMTSGVPIVIRTKFSSHSYITECAKHKCTIGMYIGEICRFIFLVPPADTDRKHNLRMMLGNGLSNELWPKFQDRFNVRMAELYGSTEGNCNMINSDGKIGAVGFLPAMLPYFLYPYYVIRIDSESLEPIRGPDGLCVRCDYGEPGMLVGRIKNTLDSKFYGYVNKESETKAKLIHNVFKKGDTAFITGDLLVIDEYRYIYFKDRTGDSFRWMGENVSTVEIESIVAGLVHKTCACYGVKIKGYDGFAGMMCIEDPEGTVDLNKLVKDLVHHLPKYSIPRFLRIVGKIELTSTHKIIKRSFAKEGINLDVIKDKVYYLDINSMSFEPLTKEIIKGIEDFKVPM